MKKTLLNFGWVFLSLITVAQVSRTDPNEFHTNISKLCGGMDSVWAKKGAWKKVEDATIFPDKTFPTSQYGQLKSRMEKILPLFKEAFPDLSGFEPRWYRVIDGTSYIPNGPVPYAFSSLYFTYYCNDNMKQILLGDETGNWVYVYVNHLAWFCYKEVDDWNINDDGKMIRVYTLPNKVGKWKGMTLYAPHTNEFDRAVVIAHDGKLPWHSLTQKQYLTGLKNKLQSEFQKTMNGYDEYEEKLKNNIDHNEKNSSPEASKIKQALEKQLSDFQSQKEGYKARSKNFYGEKLKYIDDYLDTASAETLQQVAIIDPKYGAFEFKGTFGNEDNGGRRLIAVGSKYFKDLPRYVPQFMILYWQWTHDPVSLRFKEQFEENFPIEKLKAMIDK
jgi:hypothetical protein